MVHSMTKSMWTRARRTSHSKILGINMELTLPLAASTLLGRLSTRCWNIAAGDYNSATRALVLLPDVSTSQLQHLQLTVGRSIL